MIKAYRIELSDIGYIGTFETLIGEPTPVDINFKKEKIVSEKVFDGCLYCPKEDLIVNEIPAVKITKEIHNLTWQEKNKGMESLRPLGSLSEEERTKFWELQKQLDHFYETASFVEDGKEKEYKKEMESLYE